MLDALFLAAVTTAEPSGNPISALANTFGLDVKIILAQIVNFGVVSFLLWKFAFKPVMQTMDQRQQKIADGLQYAEEAKRQLAEAEKRQAEILRDAQAEGQRILQEIKEKSRVFYDAQVAETARKVEDMLQRGKESNELERLRILSDVRKEIANLVVATSAKVLRNELQAPQKQRLNEAAAAEIAGMN